MRGKDLGDGGRGIGVRPRRETGDRRGWDARYTRKCTTTDTDCQVICCISFEWSGKLKKMRVLRAWKRGRRLKLKDRVGGQIQKRLAKGGSLIRDEDIFDPNLVGG